MPAPENPKVGGCYIWFISFLLFVFTISGAVFLVLYVIQPPSKATLWYACIGTSLVFLPWFFWILTFLYRVVSRNCGFRMNCFGPAYSDNDDNVPHTRSNMASNNAAVVVPIANDGIVGNGTGNGDNNLVLGEVNDNEHCNENKPASPRRVHFGGVVILGEEDDVNNVENQGSPKVLSRSSSSSSSSSRHSNESEMPLRLSMA